MARYGNMLLFGEGTSPDKEEAINYLQNGIRKGNAEELRLHKTIWT